MSINMQWTKTTESLPPEPKSSWGDKYLCTIINNQVVAMDYVKTTVRGKEVIRWEWCGKISPWDIIAWMPFPKAYEE